MKRVSIRTLILMLELLGFLLAYQFMVPRAGAPVQARAARAEIKPYKPAGAGMLQDPAMSTPDLPEDIANCTPALRRAIEAPRTWHGEIAADPNDRAERDDSGPGSEVVE